MQKTVVGLCAVTALLAAGCWQKSLHPFYAEADVVYDAGLVGQWIEDTSDGKPSRWTFAKAEDKGYALVIVDGENRAHSYDAHLFQFERQRFLDLVSRDRNISTIPAHHLFKVELAGGSCRFFPLNPEWVQEQLKASPALLPHIRVRDPEQPHDRSKDELVLVADTKQLQRFLREHLREPELFAEPVSLKTQPAAAPNASGAPRDGQRFGHQPAPTP